MSDYNDVWSNLDGATNYNGVSQGAHDISVDPQFVNLQAGDFHLKSTSPCLDAGDPASDYSNEPEPNGGRINLGAYGNTSEATRSYPPEIVVNVDQISFDSVFVDSLKGQYFRIYNQGAVDLKVSGISANDKLTFSVSPDSALISPGDSQEVYIAFSPEKEMLYIDTLTILNNDHLLKLVITGKGVTFRAFPSYTGNLFTKDTTGYYDLWAAVNFLIENPVVKVIASKNNGVSFTDTLNGVLDRGQYHALCPACPLETTLKFYYELTDLSGQIYRLPADAPSTTFTLNVCSYREGDSNGDWKVNVFDLLEILKQLKNPDAQNNLCDINGDGKINKFDLLALLKLLCAN